MSPELKEFYREIQEWIDGGCEKHSVLNELYGLCHNLQFWRTENFGYYKHMELDDEQMDMLKVSYPFNTSMNDYFRERHKYANPKRLAWIKKHAA